MQHCDLVVIGAGMAALKLVETLRRRGDRRSIALVGEETSLPYNRIMLSPLLAGSAEWPQLISHPTQWYQDQSVQLVLGQVVSAVDITAHSIAGPGGFVLHYDTLVFATGSRAALPTLPGTALPGVEVFRSAEDVEALLHAASLGGNAVVLGGGLLGIEAAAALAKRGMQVTLVHRSSVLMNRQLDEIASNCLVNALKTRGVGVQLGDAPVAIEGVDQVRGVRLESGITLPATLVVIATGIVPEVVLARAAGLNVKQGIIVDARMQTAMHSVHAIGECCELNGETVGLVAPIWQQVEVLAANLCGQPQAFVARPYVTMLKVSGVDVHVMGDIDAGTVEGLEVLCYRDRAFGIYKKLVLRQRRVVGALLFGDIDGSQLFFQLIQNQTEIDADYCRLLLAAELPAAPSLATA